MHPTLSFWLKNMDKLSHLIDRLQELASATSLDLRRQLYGQVDSLRTAFKRQHKWYFEFLRLIGEHANWYFLDISTEIELQSSFFEAREAIGHGKHAEADCNILRSQNTMDTIQMAWAKIAGKFQF